MLVETKNAEEQGDENEEQKARPYKHHGHIRGTNPGSSTYSGVKKGTEISATWHLSISFTSTITATVLHTYELLLNTRPCPKQRQREIRKK